MRQFTRKDVEDYFNKFWGATFRASGDTVTVNSIAWLKDITPPVWCVDFSTVSTSGHHYYGKVLLIQHSRVTSQGHKECYLTSPGQHILPEWAATVKDEDALLKQQARDALLQQQARKEAAQVAAPLTDEERRHYAPLNGNREFHLLK